MRNLQGQLYYIRRRTDEEISLAENWTVEKMEAVGTGAGGFKDIQLDSERVQDPEYLVVEARCTHLGCAPKFRPEVGAADLGGEDWRGGFFCPCHGSKFDLSGRVYAGVPASANLEVPPYSFEGDNILIIGVDTEAA